MTERVLILGGGHAAAQLCASLRQGGWGGAITLLGEEPVLPYQRPPLSKSYLSADLEAERLLVRPPSFYEQQEIELRLGQRAVTIDLENARVETEAGERLPYDRLVLATGTRPRRLACPGHDLAGIGYVRTLADVDALKDRFASARRLAVIGAGYIGLETAAVARKRGLDVTVIEAQPRVLARVTGEEVAAYYEAMHREQGVAFRFGTMLAAFEGQGVLGAIRLSDGETVACDLAVVGVGVVPNQELAAEAGLDVADGVVVDEHCRTSDPRVLAIGDVTAHPSVYGRTVRLESVHNAIEQAKTAAATLNGKPVPYRQAPWFWSDQYDAKLQTVGLLQGHDRTIRRGTPLPGGQGGFSVFYLAGSRLLAVDAVNDPVSFMASKRLIRQTVDADALGDVTVTPKSLGT